MTKLAAVARFALAEFGPLIVFWLLALTLGVKPAILGSIVFIVADAVWRWRKGLKFTRLYLLVSALPLIFDFTVHAEIRGGGQQCRDQGRLHSRRSGREAD